MAGRPDDRVDVELVEDDGRHGGAPDAAGGTDRRPASVTSLVRRRLRPAWAVLGGVALVVAVGVIVALVDEPEDDVGVPLDRPLDGLWSAPDSDVLGAGDGVVVLESDSVLVGVAEATGEISWRVELGADGPADGCFHAVTTHPATLWCWRNRAGVGNPETGQAEIRESAMVGLSFADGAIATSHTGSVPSAGVVAVGEQLVVAEREDATLTLIGFEPHRWSAEWSLEITLEPQVALGQYSAWIEGDVGLVVVHGPTAALVDPADGALLAVWPPVDDPIRPDADGADLVVTEHGFAAYATMADGVRLEEGAWYGRDGTLRAEFEGVLAEPEMSDGSESGVFLVTRSDGETLVGVDARTGADLWTYPLGGGRTLVRHSGLVVVADRHEVVALELLSGLRLWHSEVIGLRADAGSVSDGRVVVVLAVQGREWVMEAFSIGTGDRLWFADAPGAPDLDDMFVVFRPHLELVAERPVVRLGGALTWVG